MLKKLCTKTANERKLNYSAGPGLSSCMNVLNYTGAADEQPKRKQTASVAYNRKTISSNMCGMPGMADIAICFETLSSSCILYIYSIYGWRERENVYTQYEPYVVV